MAIKNIPTRVQVSFPKAKDFIHQRKNLAREPRPEAAQEEVRGNSILLLPIEETENQQGRTCKPQNSD